MALTQNEPGPEKKGVSIREMFGKISPRYDLANTVLSAGIHHRWRKKVVARSQAGEGSRILDCATGTGDLAFEFERTLGGSATVVATDFCTPMLDRAREKARDKASRVQFEEADVLNLPFQDSSFDVASIAFGIRNVSDPVRGLAELARVVRPGGSVLVLEFGQPRSGVLKHLYSSYSRHVLPALGGWISGDADAYSYLESSSSSFPCREEFLELGRGTGLFSQMDYESLTFGIAYSYRFQRARTQG